MLRRCSPAGSSAPSEAEPAREDRSSAQARCHRWQVPKRMPISLDVTTLVQTDARVARSSEHTDISLAGQAAGPIRTQSACRVWTRANDLEIWLIRTSDCTCNGLRVGLTPAFPWSGSNLGACHCGRMRDSGAGGPIMSAHSQASPQSGSHSMLGPKQARLGGRHRQI
jgi:hypothetical protein